MLTIDWGPRIINVPQTYLTPLGGTDYELDVDQFRLDLKQIEESEEGMPFVDTHSHVTEITLSGVTYARFVQIINGYTITFQDGQYTVQTVGANHNINDVRNANQVSLVTNNSAGLIKVETGGSGGSGAASFAGATDGQVCVPGQVYNMRIVYPEAQSNPIHGLYVNGVLEGSLSPQFGTGTVWSFNFTVPVGASPSDLIQVFVETDDLPEHMIFSGVVYIPIAAVNANVTDIDTAALAKFATEDTGETSPATGSVADLSGGTP